MEILYCIGWLKKICKFVKNIHIIEIIGNELNPYILKEFTD